MIHFVERHGNEEHEAVSAMKGKDDEGKHPAQTEHVKYSAGGVVEEMFLSSMFLTIQGGRTEPVTPFGKLMVLTFSGERDRFVFKL